MRKLCQYIFILLGVVGCTPLATPTPTSPVATFAYQVLVRDSTTRLPIIGANITLIIGGEGSITGLTDDNGIAILRLSETHLNMPVIRTIVADSYNFRSEQINITEVSITQEVALTPIESDEKDEQISSVTNSVSPQPEGETDITSTSQNAPDSETSTSSELEILWKLDLEPYRQGIIVDEVGSGLAVDILDTDKYLKGTRDDAYFEVSNLNLSGNFVMFVTLGNEYLFDYIRLSSNTGEEVIINFRNAYILFGGDTFTMSRYYTTPWNNDENAKNTFRLEIADSSAILSLNGTYLSSESVVPNTVYNSLNISNIDAKHQVFDISIKRSNP